jgi:integrase
MRPFTGVLRFLRIWRCGSSTFAEIDNMQERREIRWPTDADLANFAKSQVVFMSAGVMLSTPRKGEIKNRWEDARANAEQALRGYRFHDLRHQCITELAEGGASDHTLMALAGHLSRRMMEHYSHVRMAVKREAIDKLAAGLMAPAAEEAKPASEAVN